MKKSPKSSLEWYQNETTLTIHLPCPGVTLKKLDFYLTDGFLKINFLEKNLIKFLDFSFEIDFQSKETNFLLINEKLEISLAKKQPGVWTSLLLEGLDRKDLIKRREEAINRRNLVESKYRKNLEDIKIKYDQYSVSEQMRLERNEREFIDNQKKIERETAERELYETIESMKKEKNRIFDEEDEEEQFEEIREIPEPREQKNVKVKFTEKVYPHLAAREQHLKDAPMPKINSGTEKGGNEVNILRIRRGGGGLCVCVLCVGKGVCGEGGILWGVGVMELFNFFIIYIFVIIFNPIFICGRGGFFYIF